MSERLNAWLYENAFLPDPRKRKKLDTSKPIDIRLKDEKDKRPIYHRLPKEGVFKQYEDLEIIAANIAKELLDKETYEPIDIANSSYKRIIESGQGFFMASSHASKRTGILSLCPAVLTAMKIWNALPNDAAIKPKLYANIESAIDAIFKIIYRDGDQLLNDEAPVFDASPYVIEQFTKGMSGKSYIDSISWAIPVFLRIMNLTEKKEKKEVLVFQDKLLRKKVAFLAKWCLQYTNKSIIINLASTPIGWNFTKLDKTSEAERSLYFTYAASTIYLSFYAEYEQIILSMRTLEEYINSTDDENCIFDLSERYWENKNGELDIALKAVSEKLAVQDDDDLLNDLDSDEAEQLEKIKGAINVLLDQVNAEKIVDLLEFNDNYKFSTLFINKNGIIEKAGQITELKYYLEKISEDLWLTVGDKLEDKFLYEDYCATVAENDAIENGGQTNALFTGLLQIGIILNSGYDIKLYREKGEREYDKMQDTMFLHVQKAQRFFDKLEDSGKSFGVDSLILRFMEKIPESTSASDKSDRALAERLRKHYIRVCSLTPMLLKTNNLLSEYVIQYPQKQMGESLLRISQKRFIDKAGTRERYRWLWETDGYHAISNYYYVNAIFEFYAYYNKYEQSYVKRYENMRSDLLRDLNFTDQVRKHYQDIADEKLQIAKEYEEKLKEKDDEIADAMAKVKKSEIGDRLVSDINQLIEDSEYFDNTKFFKRILKGIRMQLAQELVKKYLQNPQEDRAILNELLTPAQPKDNTLTAHLQALAADIILPSAIDAKKNEGTGLINDLGKSGLEEVLPGDFVLRGGSQLINDGLIDKLFAFMCSALIWQDNKK